MRAAIPLMEHLAMMAAFISAMKAIRLITTPSSCILASALAAPRLFMRGSMLVRIDGKRSVHTRFQSSGLIVTKINPADPSSCRLRPRYFPPPRSAHPSIFHGKLLPVQVRLWLSVVFTMGTRRLNFRVGSPQSLPKFYKP